VSDTTAPVPVLTTERAGAPADGTVIITPAGRADLIIKTMTPVVQVIVRGLRTYVQALVGFLLLGLGGGLDNIGGVQSSVFIVQLKIAASLALAPAVIAVLQNSAELLAKLDERMPKARA
jgi:hypothetical protein